MHWNHRVIKKLDPKHSGDSDWEMYEIHECFYNGRSNKIPYTWTITPITPSHGTLKDLKWQLQKMLRATKFPVLVEYTDKKGKTKLKEYKHK